VSCIFLVQCRMDFGKDAQTENAYSDKAILQLNASRTCEMADRQLITAAN